MPGHGGFVDLSVASTCLAGSTSAHENWTCPRGRWPESQTLYHARNCPKQGYSMPNPRRSSPVCLQRVSMMQLSADVGAYKRFSNRHTLYRAAQGRPATHAALPM
nr:hypothetical protein CFP56_20373 [Quercus suber]